MNQADFDEVVRDTMQNLSNLLLVKGGEYAGSEDRLANFKRGAFLTGVQPLTVLLIYLSKHYDAVATYVRDKQTGVDRPRSETIQGRLDDLINYCILAKAIIREENQANQASADAGQRIRKMTNAEIAALAAEQQKIFNPFHNRPVNSK